MNKLQSDILEAMHYDMEPFEAIDLDVSSSNPGVSCDEVLTNIFAMFQQGWIIIQQAPIEAFGQTFPERQIDPTTPEEIMGDLFEYYKQYREKRDYLRKYALSEEDTPAGVPFGIYFDLTESGRAELDKIEAAYEAEEPD